MSSHLTGLSKAFGNTSDPHYLFQSQTHANALSLLAGGMEENRNIRVLTGEPGMGKTILLLHLLGRFQHSAFTAHLFWTQLGRGEFLHYFLHELGVSQPPADIAQARKQLTRVLEREFSQGRGVVVAIDEAHDLEVPALLGLAELLDCNLARSKQLQVVFAGLPQLLAKLESPKLQGIRDQISAIASLNPLTPEETASYINRRLEVSGYRGDVPFTSEAMATIASLAQGIPRNINNICFGALYLAEKRACSVIDCAIILETAQREGRLTGQEITQEASSENLTLPDHAASDQQTSGSAQPHISAADLPNATVENVASRCALAAVLVGNEAIAAVPDRIRQWFGNERVAWSGTVGELAAALHESEIELLQALHTNSEVLRSFGIAVTVCETVGRTRSVSLRRLEGRKQANAEEANTGSRLPASELDSAQNSDGINCPAENVSSHGQPSHGAMEVRTENLQADSASGSAADQALDLLRATVLQEVAETRVSRSRWAAVGLLIALVALAVGLAGGHSPALKRIGSVMRSAQQLTGRKAVIGGKEESTRVASDTKTNAFSPLGQESAQESAPPVSSASQLLSASPVPQQHGGRPETAETTEPFQQAALSGDPNAQLELGTAYALGRGVPADPVIGYTWLTLAFANGDEQAESLIRELTRKLSQSEIARIRWNLGEMYANGVGVHPDKVTAYMWHLLAEFAGETRSRIARSQLEPTMTADQKSEANARAAQWLRRHHQSSNR
jgi:type II secretory pathway predicted ATPase ExeA